MKPPPNFLTAGTPCGATAVKTFLPLVYSRAATLIFSGLLLGAWAGPVWGHVRKSATTDAAGDHLKAGQFPWQPELAPSGTLTMIIDRAHQRAYVYRVRIGATTISSGKPDYETPTGVFTILQKDKNHSSKKYHHAPMPYADINPVRRRPLQRLFPVPGLNFTSL
ncbi:MAG TPA: L,D-transpeptidase family protein, partial [Rhizomicrobium sp.]